jgi:hypothetical protein
VLRIEINDETVFSVNPIIDNCADGVMNRQELAKWAPQFDWSVVVDVVDEDPNEDWDPDNDFNWLDKLKQSEER